MKLYKQTTKFTCAASSLLMIIHHFYPSFKLTQENEFDIWRKTACLPTRGSSIYGLATFAKQKGLKAVVFVEEISYKFPDYRFRAYKKEEVEEAKKFSDILYKEAIENNVKVIKKKLTLKDVKENLRKGKIVLLRLNRHAFLKDLKLKNRRPEVNYLPVVSYQQKKFTILDPIKGKLVLDKKLVENLFREVNTKCRRDNRMLVLSK